MAKSPGVGMISNNNRGISLVELIVSLLILTIGIAGVIKLQSTYFYYHDLSKQRATAVTLAEQKMETLRYFQVIPTTGGYVAYNDIASSTSSSTVNSTSYTTTSTISTNTSIGYKTVNIVVSWSDRRGTSQSVDLTSIIGQIDPSASGVIVNA